MFVYVKPLTLQTSHFLLALTLTIVYCELKNKKKCGFGNILICNSTVAPHEVYKNTEWIIIIRFHSGDIRTFQKWPSF